MQVDLAKYAIDAGKGVSKLFVRVSKIVQNKPKLLKGVNFAQLQITELSEDIATFLTKAQKPDGSLAKIQKFLEKNLTTLVQNVQKVKTKGVNPSFSN